MEKREQLYEGKAKKVFATEDPELYIVDYKDDATAFNGEKKGTIIGNLHIVNPQVFYPHPCLGAEHAGQIARRDMALRASDGFALCVLGVRGEHQFILIHAHFMAGQAKLRPRRIRHSRCRQAYARGQGDTAHNPDALRRIRHGFGLHG